MDMLLARPSGSDRLAGLYSLLQQLRPSSGSPYSSSQSDTTGTVVPGDVEGSQLHIPDPSALVGGADAQAGVVQGRPEINMTGETQYPYNIYDMPFTGTPDNLVTRHGVTLQRGPMHSLVDIFRNPDLSVLPGLQELNQVTPGSFRTYQDTVELSDPSSPRYNPNAASTPGTSYHQQGLAVDYGWLNNYPGLMRALRGAGWNQFDSAAEPWHYSYGVTG